MVTADRRERTREIVSAHRGVSGALLPVLHELQHEFGFIDADLTDVLADELNVSVAEVHGVVTFYRDFRRQPPGRTVVRFCRGEACQANGSEALVAHFTERTGLRPGETSTDRALSADDVYCFGNCALGPSVEIAGRLQGRVTPARIDALLEQSR